MAQIDDFMRLALAVQANNEDMEGFDEIIQEVKIKMNGRDNASAPDNKSSKLVSLDDLLHDEAHVQEKPRDIYELANDDNRFIEQESTLSVRSSPIPATDFQPKISSIWPNRLRVQSPSHITQSFISSLNREVMCAFRRLADAKKKQNSRTKDNLRECTSTTENKAHKEKKIDLRRLFLQLTNTIQRLSATIVEKARKEKYTQTIRSLNGRLTGFARQVAKWIKWMM